jgi:hypothetical protein
VRDQVLLIQQLLKGKCIPHLPIAAAVVVAADMPAAAVVVDMPKAADINNYSFS